MMVMDQITKRTIYYWIIEVFSLLGLIYALAPLFVYKKLPEHSMVPIHFNIVGHPDSWGGSYHIIIYSLLSVFFYLLMSFLERNYKILNYPIKITSNNSEAVYRLGVRLVRHLKLFVTLLFAYFANLSFGIAMGEANVNSQYVIVLLIGGLVGSLLILNLKMIRLKR